MRGTKSDMLFNVEVREKGVNEEVLCWKADCAAQDRCSEMTQDGLDKVDLFVQVMSVKV